MDLVNILQAVKWAGTGPRLLGEPFIDTTSELADLIALLVGSAARWHRRRILENTAQGRELARRRGVKFGRKPKLSEFQRQEVLRRCSDGEAAVKAAQAFGVSEWTILRIRRRDSIKQ